ncbi:MAG: hypothetical protein M3R38_07310 [Actinomycetota bacterium]|nr:hypothetical protein [Actinomycetota bacterium]
MRFDPQEAERLARSVSALLDEMGGVEEIRELDVREFRCRLDADDEGAERTMRRISDLGVVHSASAALLDVFSSALRLQNPSLARAALAGVQALALQQRSAAAEEAAGDDEEGV